MRTEAHRKPIVATFVALGLSVSADGFTETNSSPFPPVSSISVRGTNIRYVEQGHGTPVLFIHGGGSDHRIWENQRRVVGERYRFIAIDQRYFGTASWPDEGAEFSLATHVADLAEFIRALHLEPVYLVGHSYGAVVSLSVAMQHPELVRGLVINEPPLTSIVTDPADAEIVRDDGTELTEIGATARAGDASRKRSNPITSIESAHSCINHLRGAESAHFAYHDHIRQPDAAVFPADRRADPPLCTWLESCRHTKCSAWGTGRIPRDFQPDIAGVSDGELGVAA